MEFLTTCPTSTTFHIVLNSPNLIRIFISHKTVKWKKTTMDFKNVLYLWKSYQRLKLKMANSYPCTLSYSDDRTIYHGNLSLCGTQGERRLEIRARNFVSTILLSEVTGTTPDGLSIMFFLLERRVATMTFPNEAITTAVREAFEMFQRDEFGLTPPSSSESE